MTVTEREEEGNSSNTNIVEIKNEPVKFELLQQEEQEEIDALLNVLLKGAYFYDDQLQIEIEKEEDAEESERSTKRIRTAESDEVESSSIKNTASLEENQPELGIDPLEVLGEILLKYHDFINEIYQMLKDEQTDEHKKVKIQWQKWRDILDKGNLMVEDLNGSLKTVEIEMEWMKSIDELHREYSVRKTHVPDLLALLRDINERIESSPNFKVVSDMKKRDEVLKMCLDELETSKEELAEMVEVIQELKELDLQDDEAVAGRILEEIGVEEVEKFNAEFDEVLKEMDELDDVLKEMGYRAR